MEAPGRVLQEEERAKAFRSALQRGHERLADLEIRSPLTGRVIHRLDENAIGSFVQVGDAVATIAAGRWQVRALMTEDSLQSAGPKEGDTVQFRSSADPALTIEGVIVRVSSAGSRIVQHEPLTHLGGGDIAVNPETFEAREPYFEVVVDLHVDSMPGPGYGMTGTVCFGGTSESVGTILYRRLSRFIQMLMQD
ncbi:MAG: HlyD family secretion protein [Planctomycetes bacterium]|nr:HlyD family secretion protein [Planctomycetota bacterium]